MTRSNGIKRASKSQNRLWRSCRTSGSVIGSGMPTERYTLAIASAASSSDFTNTPRRSAQSAIGSASNMCRDSPYTSPMKPAARNPSAYTLYAVR